MTEQEAKQPWPSLVIFALAMGGFAIGVTEFATMSLLPYFARDLGVDAPTAGHAISAYALGVVVGAPVIAVLAARMSRQTLLILLMGLVRRRQRARGFGLPPSAGSSPSASSADCRMAPISALPRWLPPRSYPPTSARKR